LVVLEVLDGTSWRVRYECCGGCHSPFFLNWRQRLIRQICRTVGHSRSIPAAAAGSTWMVPRSMRPCAFLTLLSHVHRGKNRLVEGRFDILPQCLLIVLDRKDIVAAALDDLGSNRLLAKDRVAGDDFALHVAPSKELECIGNFQPLPPEHRLQVSAERREHMLGTAVAVLTRPHRLAVDRDMLRGATLLQTQRAQHIGQSLCVDDPQRFRQRRMTRRTFHGQSPALLSAAGSGCVQEQKPPSSRAGRTTATE
jgi:hypothetical protein